MEVAELEGGGVQDGVAGGDGEGGEEGRVGGEIVEEVGGD